MKKHRSHKEIYGWGLSIVLALPLLWYSYAGMASVEAMSQQFYLMGLPLEAVMPLSIILCVGVIMYLLPFLATAMMGMGLLLAYFGGAVAINLITGVGSFVVPALFGALLVVGLCLRNEKFAKLFDCKKTD